uniref:Transcriptional regulator, XRE family n=1 Tax=Cereibacter sphaeroides (strain ATCC 17025 / ATH 2.4.3) TaxID=349102 RepID=A4WSA6_CERS5
MKTSRRIFDSETMLLIGDRLRQVRGQRTLEEFADKLGLARSTWSNYEAGRRLPSHEVLDLLWKVEGVPPDSILPGAKLARTVRTNQTDEWPHYIPVFWLFQRLHSRTSKELGEEESLKWWAEAFTFVAAETGNRLGQIAEQQDLYMEDAALSLCQELSTRSDDELMDFVRELRKA